MCVSVCVFVPDGEKNEACDDKYCSKNDEDVVTGVSPPSIVEHLSRLSKEKEWFTNKWIQMRQMIIANLFKSKWNLIACFQTPGGSVGFFASNNPLGGSGT